MAAADHIMKDETTIRMDCFYNVADGSERCDHERYPMANDFGEIRLKPRIGFMDDQVDAKGRWRRPFRKTRFNIIKPVREVLGGPCV
jgi:hypothetical protein